MKKVFSLLTFTLLTAALFTACGGGNSEAEQSSPEPQATEAQETHGLEFKAGDVQLTTPLNQEWVTAGKATYDLKCQSCHKLNDERVVGPGWKDVTKRREPHWIMNMITNVDMMLETDPEAQNCWSNVSCACLTKTLIRTRQDRCWNLCAATMVKSKSR